ncbi:hypothetical protein STEG23_016080, partial [Scotinomys teguina]
HHPPLKFVNGASLGLYQDITDPCDMLIQHASPLPHSPTPITFSEKGMEQNSSTPKAVGTLLKELSLSAGCRQLEHRKGNLPSSVSRKLYFDTHALVCLLEANGFTTQQAEIIVSALVKNTETNMDIVYNDMVTKVQQEITLQQVMSKIANVKKDMVILEKSEFSALRAENEKIKLELHQLKQQVMDEVIKVRTDTKLNFNLEKSRVKELYSLNEKKMLQLKTEMVSLVNTFPFECSRATIQGPKIDKQTENHAAPYKITFSFGELEYRHQCDSLVYMYECSTCIYVCTYLMSLEARRRHLILLWNIS